MNTPTKAVEATSPAQNADKTADKTAANNDMKAETPEKKPEVTNPAPAPVK